MEQRPLRLGDHVDDYCPRERRITNHTIVALVDDAIKQTRCTTCESDHVYKGGKTPRRRKKDGTSALYDEVLANAPGGQLVVPEPAGDEAPAPAAEAAPGEAAKALEAAGDVTDAVDGEAPDETPADDTRDEGFSAHRPLIRATLPRTENDQPPPRPIPEFTMHQRNARGGHSFRQGFGWPDRGGAGRSGNGFRGPGGRSGQGQGQPPGPGQGRRRHGKRRPR